MTTAIERRKEYHRKYQQTEEFKESKKQMYLNKVKCDYKSKTEKFVNEFQKKTKMEVRNELDILQMIDEADDTKEVKQIYDGLIKLIKI